MSAKSLVGLTDQQRSQIKSWVADRKPRKEILSDIGADTVLVEEYLREIAPRYRGRFTEEHRKSISESRKGQPCPEVTKKKLAELNTGKRHSEESRKKMSEKLKERWSNPEERERQSQRMMRKGTSGVPSFKDRGGYVILRYQYDHPLADSSFYVKEHRKVLYDKIGPGPHKCYWCGGEVDWKLPSNTEQTRKGELVVDHLNGVKDDNRPENLEPSCVRCNWGRVNE